MKRHIVALVAVLFSLMLLANTVWAAETEDKQLTLNEAIEKAVNHSQKAKRDELEIDRTEVDRNEAAKDVKYTPVRSDVYTPNPEAEVNFYILLQKDIKWNTSKRDYDARLDGVALDVCQQYWEILKLQEQVKVKEIAIEKARVDLQNSRAAYTQGLVSKLSQAAAMNSASFAGLEQAESDLVQAEGALEETQHDLTEAYIKLNQLLGLNSNDRPELVDSLEFYPLEKEVSLDIAVSRALENSPAIWNAEQQVHLQKYVEHLNYVTGEYTSSDGKDIEQKQAKIDVANAKDLTKLTVQNTYYSLKTMEEQYKVAKKSIVVLEESLRVAQLRFDVGMATKADVVGAKSQLTEAKQKLVDLAKEHSYQKLVFQKPWAPGYTTL